MGRVEKAAMSSFNVCSRPEKTPADYARRPIPSPSAWLSFESNSLKATLQRDARQQNR